MRKHYARWIKLSIFVLGLSLICILLIGHYSDRRALIKSKQKQVHRSLKEIAELKKLGFSDTDEVINVVRDRVKRIQTFLGKLNSSGSIFARQPQMPLQQRAGLMRLLQLHKKMICGYARDIQEWRNLGIPSSNKMVQFAHNQLVHLAISYADLDQEIKHMRNGHSFDIHHLEKIHQMISINQKSIVYYKQEIGNYQESNVLLSNPKMVCARMQLTHKSRAIAALEKLLE